MDIIAGATSALKGGSIGAFVKNTNPASHSVHSFITYYNNTNADAMHNLVYQTWFIPIMTDFSPSNCKPVDSFNECSFTGYEEGELEYHIMDITIPNISVPTTQYNDATGSYTRPSTGITNASSKQFSINILNTKTNVIDKAFYDWMTEVGNNIWNYSEKPYTTCTFKVIMYSPGQSNSFNPISNLPIIGSLANDAFSAVGDFVLGNDTPPAGSDQAFAKSLLGNNHLLSIYTFTDCYPIDIELCSATNTETGKFTRKVTFAFDDLLVDAYFPSKSDNSSLKALGGELLNMGTTAINKALTPLTDKLENVLDTSFVSKFFKNIRDKKDELTNSLVKYAINKDENDLGIDYKFKQDNSNIGNSKHSDLMQLSINQDVVDYSFDQYNPKVGDTKYSDTLLKDANGKTDIDYKFMHNLNIENFKADTTSSINTLLPNINYTFKQHNSSAGNFKAGTTSSITTLLKNINYTFKQYNPNVGDFKTSDLKSSDIRRTFNPTF